VVVTAVRGPLTLKFDPLVFRRMALATKRDDQPGAVNERVMVMFCFPAAMIAVALVYRR
jgi:hypothetical protein